MAYYYKSIHNQLDAAAAAPPLDLIFNELISGAYIHGTLRKLSTLANSHHTKIQLIIT
jgi:hypothetical protein